ncbi:MAG: MBOAT family protein [Chitinophagales bacterium]|nr:MBOAT family protein [Chitinophagales bacterium]
MVFSSSIFLFYFFPVFLLAYFITPVHLKNYTALIASVAFYAWGAPKFIFIVLIILIADFFLGNKIFESRGNKKKWLLIFSLSINVGSLLYFKYANFFVENFNDTLQALGFNAVSWARIALPIGISFFTFQEMSYTIDIYRGVHKPLTKFSDYMLFIFMFSHLIAGPIVTYHILADDIVERRHQLNLNYKIQGALRFTIGLAKKVLIANQLAVVADQVFGQPAGQLNFYSSWMGAIAYTFQLYFDFSGYSDMAIGIGKFLGFNFPENFNNPYISQSITEFWRRWHITLGNWMRNYLYIPLGGNRVSISRMYFNLWVVFLISGFWHGAEWTFVVWGIYHGLFIVLDRLFLVNLLKPVSKIFRIALTFLIVVLGWILFRSTSLAQAFNFYHCMFSFNLTMASPDLDYKFIFFLLIAIFFSFFGVVNAIEQNQIKWFNPERWLIPKILSSILLMFWCLAEISSGSFNPFIYFRF